MTNNSILNRILLIVIFLGLFSVLNAQTTSTAAENLITSMLEQEDNYFYLDTLNYPKNRNELPIGIFDSGTGGLTVFNSIIQLDSFYNGNHSTGKDGLNDFMNEKFIYLGDHANMPYGNYHKENKDELLQEHIIKDVHFLLSNKYYPTSESSIYKTDKIPVKSIVIACNTATAYGTEKINLLMKLSGLQIKVIGVIDAGVKGALSELNTDEDGIIAVMATQGTVSSKGYEKTIYRMLKNRGMKGNVDVFSQGGIGIAESLDGDTDYYNPKAAEINTTYKGPGLNSGIDSTLFDYYNFDFSNGKMLCDNDNLDDCRLMQINDPVNYMRFHLVSLMEQIRVSKTQNKLKVIILGCTHYPFLSDEINQVLKELYNYKSTSGEYRYRPYMSENIKLIDPAQNTALELYEHLKEEKLFSVDNKLSESELYISVPNRDNINNDIDESGRFPYEYKYGRTAGVFQEYVKRIHMTQGTIDEITLQRIQEQMPVIFSMIKE